MIIEKNNDGTYTAFQRLQGSKTKGVVCEAETIAEAMNGAFEMVKQVRGVAADNDNPFKGAA